LAPSVSVVASTVTMLAVTTSLLSKFAVPLAATVSVPTRPPVTVSVGAAVVLPSYTLSGAATFAVSAFGVICAAVLVPAARL
jgi:hypothetical protein